MTSSSRPPRRAAGRCRRSSPTSPPAPSSAAAPLTTAYSPSPSRLQAWWTARPAGSASPTTCPPTARSTRWARWARASRSPSSSTTTSTSPRWARSRSGWLGGSRRWCSSASAPGSGWGSSCTTSWCAAPTGRRARSRTCRSSVIPSIRGTSCTAAWRTRSGRRACSPASRLAPPGARARWRPPRTSSSWPAPATTTPERWWSTSPPGWARPSPPCARSSIRSSSCSAAGSARAPCCCGPCAGLRRRSCRSPRGSRRACSVTRRLCAGRSPSPCTRRAAS